MSTSKGRARTADAAPAKKHEETGTDVAVVDRPTGGAVVSQAMAEMYGDDFGAGTSQSVEDNLVPMAMILHTQSPELKPKDPAYIEGAAFGDVIIRAFREVIPCGEEGGGLVVVPVAFQKYWNEWVPRNKGGGLVATHADRPAEAREEKDPQTGASRWTMKNGNDLIETRMHVVLMNDMPLAIPFTSTGHTVSRGWQSMMNSLKHNGRVLPSWARRYHLGTTYRKNAAGDWYQFQVSPLGMLDPGKPADVALYAAAKQLHADYAKGAKVIDMGGGEPGPGLAEADAADDVI